jgi:type I restriction enzyme S subunit
VTLGEVVVKAEPGFACGEDVSKGLLQLRMNNVTVDGTLDWSDRRRVPASAGDLDRYGLEPGDIMFNCTNSSDLVGKTALFSGFSEPVAYSNHFLRVRLNRKRAEPGYVSWWLFRQWRRREFERLAICWVNQATVRKDDLLDMQIDLPDLPVQRRIAGMLDKADRLRRMRRYALELSGQFLPALFLRMFGDPARIWPLATLGDVARDFAYGTSVKCSYDSRLAPVLRIPNVLAGELNRADLKYGQLTETETRELRLELGDILFVRTNGNPDYVGRCAVYDLESPHWFASYLIRMRLDPAQADAVFLRSYLHGRAGRRALRTAIRTTAGQYNVSVEGLRDVRIILPPLSEQRRFGHIVSRHKRESVLRCEALRQAEHLFHSLLNQYFGSEN